MYSAQSNFMNVHTPSLLLLFWQLVYNFIYTLLLLAHNVDRETEMQYILIVVLIIVGPTHQHHYYLSKNTVTQESSI